MDDSPHYGYSYYKKQSEMAMNSLPQSIESKDDYSDCISSGEDSIRDMSMQGDAHGGFIPSRKQRAFTPDNRKDQCYWEKRRKNNEAARRSREKRRLHDLALEKRIIELCKESCILRTQLYAVKKRYGIPRDELIALDNEEQDLLDKDLHALSAVNPNTSTLLSYNVVPASIKVCRASPLGMPLVSPSGTNVATPSQNTINSEGRGVIFSMPTSEPSLTNSTAAMSPMKGLKTNTVSTTLTSIPHQYSFGAPVTVKQEPADDFPNVALNTNESQNSMDYPSSESYTTSSDTFETSTSGLSMGKDIAENIVNTGKNLESPWYHGSRESVANGKSSSSTTNSDQPLQLVVKRRKIEPELFAQLQDSVDEYHQQQQPHHQQKQPHHQQQQPHHQQLQPHHQQQQPHHQQQQPHHQQQQPPQQPHQQQQQRQQLSQSPLNHQISNFSENTVPRTSITTLPLKMRYKISLPDHTMSSVQLLSPTAPISSRAYSHDDVPTSTFHNGLTQLSEVALSQTNPLPLIKKDVNGDQAGSSLIGGINGGIEATEEDNSIDGNGNSDSFKSDQHEFFSRIDPKYVERRKRNNEAARKCRENRKALTNMREAKSNYLETENGKLRHEMGDLQEEVKQLRELLEKKRLEQGFKEKISKSDHKSVSLRA